MPRSRWASSPTSATAKENLSPQRTQRSRGGREGGAATEPPSRPLRILCALRVKAFLSILFRELEQMPFGDLTTLTDVKAWLQVGQNPFPATDDALLQRLITASSHFILSWLNRQISSA